MKKWWKDGVRFECQGSGQCCVSRGQFGFVYLTLEERQKMAAHLKISTAKFTREYCKKTSGVFHLKDADGPECIFLKDKRCSVYTVRPMQCRTWPFWPEVRGAKTWAKDTDRPVRRSSDGSAHREVRRGRNPLGHAQRLFASSLPKVQTS